MVPEFFRITAFEEDGQITLLPAVTKGSKHKLWYVLPINVIKEANSVNIGENIMEVASYIYLLENGKSENKEVKSDDVPTVLGYASWTKVKKATNYVQIWRGARNLDSEIVAFTPMHPYGKESSSYAVKDLSDIKYASIKNPTDMGQAVLDAVAVFSTT